MGELYYRVAENCRSCGTQKMRCHDQGRWVGAPICPMCDRGKCFNPKCRLRILDSTAQKCPACEAPFGLLRKPAS